jgi:hypothetical protein
MQKIAMKKVLELKNEFKDPLKKKLYQMAITPKAQIKKLAIGTFISITSFIALILTTPLESQWLFYILNGLTITGVLIAIPGYLGVWLWRMKDVFFKNYK